MLSEPIPVGVQKTRDREGEYIKTVLIGTPALIAKLLSNSEEVGDSIVLIMFSVVQARAALHDVADHCTLVVGCMSGETSPIAEKFQLFRHEIEKCLSPQSPPTSSSVRLQMQTILLLVTATMWLLS